LHGVRRGQPGRLHRSGPCRSTLNYPLRGRRARHLVNDADMVGVILQPDYVGRLAEVAPRGAHLRWSLVTDPTTSRRWPRPRRSGELRRPLGRRPLRPLHRRHHGDAQGRVWRHEDAFFACMAGGDPTRDEVRSVGELVQRIAPPPPRSWRWRRSCTPPAPGRCSSTCSAGNRVVLWARPLDPVGGMAHHRAGEGHGRQCGGRRGDAPAAGRLDGLAPNRTWGPWQTFSSGGAPLSPAVRERFLATFPSIPLADGYGSSETGIQARRVFIGRAATNPSPASTPARRW